MKYTEKENIKQLDNNKEQNIIALAFNFVKFYDKETTNIEYKDNAIKEFESCSLEVQILALDYISDLFIKEYKANRFYDLGQKHVDNFLELWNVLKSEDAKQKFAYIRFDENFMISEDSLIYKFYNNKYYDDFNTKINKDKKMSTL